MAAYHARSNSFPSIQHPLVSKFDQQLSRLRSSQEASSSASLVYKLGKLQQVLDCVDQLLMLPLNQQALRNEQNEKSVDELSEGSLRILDACNIAKNALAEIKESAQQLQSILRRRRGAESDLTLEVKKFLASRKMAKKEIQKAMKNFNRIDKGEKCDQIVSMLREVESMAVGVFDSLFSFVLEMKSQKSTSRSLVSKLMISKRVVCEEVSEPNEFESADSELKFLISAKKSDGLFG